MREILLLFLVALVAAGIVFGVIVVVTGRDHGLEPAAPDDGHRALPGDRPLLEEDLRETRFDTAVRGYRMAQVDRALNRIGYDLGYKHELVAALEAEVDALREGRMEDADLIRDRRHAASQPAMTQTSEQQSEPEPDATADQDDDQATRVSEGSAAESSESSESSEAFAPPR